MVPGCKNSSNNPDCKGLTFYSLPKDSLELATKGVVDINAPLS